MDERRFSVLGGEAEAIAERLESAYQEDLTLEAAIRAAYDALNGDADDDDKLKADELEVAALEREAPRRSFRRFKTDELAQILADR